MRPAESARTVKELARESGFDLARVARAEPLHAERIRYLAWVACGRHGDMRWITPERVERSADPTSTLPSARSVVSVGLAYWSGHRPPSDGKTGRIARYAWGRDYHAVMGERLRALAERLALELGGEHRWYVDTGPAMDKALAARAGVGWYGKNSNILTEQFGSFVLLGDIITSLELAPDRPLGRDCGSCRLCVVACPTGAIGPEYSVDSRKCISYLTIEHRGSIPLELRDKVGDWIFGCDICQDVCPPTMQPHLANADARHQWTAEVRHYVGGRTTFLGDQDTSTPTTEAPLSHPLFSEGIRPTVDLIWLLQLTHEEYAEAFRGTSIKRAKVWMLRRNAALALGNVAGPECMGALARAMREDSEPLVRGHAAWAFARVATRHGLDVSEELRAQLSDERVEAVRDEIQAALAMLTMT